MKYLLIFLLVLAIFVISVTLGAQNDQQVTFNYLLAQGEFRISTLLAVLSALAVYLLVTLLSLGVRNMYIGPTLPAFMSETVVKYLVENYKLNPITAPEQDMDAILKR